MKRLLFLLPVLAAAVVSGTTQVPDKIIFEGHAMPLFDWAPLEILWLEGPGQSVSYLPENRRRPEVFRREGVSSTGNQRGYVATWRIEMGRLWLARIEKEYRVDHPGNAAKDRFNPIFNSEYREVPIEKVIPGAKLPVFAKWYSGELRILPDEQFRYRQMAPKSMYTHEIHFEFKEGLVVSQVRIGKPREEWYRSPADLKWCPPGREIPDQGGWIDARLLATAPYAHLRKSGASFRTRGVLWCFHRQHGIDASLAVNETPKTLGIGWAIQSLPQTKLPPHLTHVEIEGRFVTMKSWTPLQVTSLRELKPGETIHHPGFPEVWERLSEQERLRAEGR